MLHFLLVPIRTLGLLGLATVAACATPAVVKTPEQAIAIGGNACSDVAKVEFRPDMWRARLDGDHWKVWYGPDERRTGNYIYVAVDGRPPDGPNQCELVFQD